MPIMEDTLMKRIATPILLILFFSTSHAQLTHTFTQTARSIPNGNPQAVAVGPDGTVFLANDYGGLIAFVQSGGSYKYVAHIDSGVDSYQVVVGPNGTVFEMSFGEDDLAGLRAYTFDGSSFNNTAFLRMTGEIAVGMDGTIFIAANDSGLWAYDYDGSSFTYAAHIREYSSTVAIGLDGVVYAAAPGDWGLRAYAYDGASFTKTAYVHDGNPASGMDGNAQNIAVGGDGTVFLANGADGFRAYSYDENSFTNTAHAAIGENQSAYRITVGSDSTLFMISDGQLYAYHYDGEFLSNTASIESADPIWDVAVAADGTLVLASYLGGLLTTTYDGDSFSIAESIYQVWSTRGVAIDQNGVMFLATNDGLRASFYDGLSFRHIARARIDIGEPLDVAVGADGTAFLIISDWCGSVFCPDSDLTDDGLRAYIYDGASLINTAHINDDGIARGVAVGPDGSIFVANGEDGLRAYMYDGVSFTNTAHINNVGNAWRVAVGSDGTVFLADTQYSQEGLWAYSFDGASFTNTAHINDVGYPSNVAIGPDGSVFVTNEDGLRAYRYDGGILHEYGTYQYRKYCPWRSGWIRWNCFSDWL